MPNSNFETTMLIVFDVGGIIILEYASATKSDSKATILLSSVSKITRRDANKYTKLVE
jgi:alpha-beta hydrolase superfamily lysophospholipase